MKLNKCKRCGSFFTTSNTVCPNCEPKDLCEITKLKHFLAENTCPNSLESLSCYTGITISNLNRYLGQKNFSTITSPVTDNSKGNISIEL